MGAILIDNKMGISANERSVLEVFSDNTNGTMKNNEKLRIFLSSYILCVIGRNKSWKN